MAVIRMEPQDNLVIIDGFSLEGWVDQGVCEACGEPRVYYVAYDAFFCATCNRWLEFRCEDPGCDLCACRPARPLGA
jgi:hypothetical protein